VRLFCKKDFHTDNPTRPKASLAGKEWFADNEIIVIS
jgi:hypothetical protein